MRVLDTHLTQVVWTLLVGVPCDASGHPLPAHAPPTAHLAPPSANYDPYHSRAQFEIADLLYREMKASGAHVDKLMQLWAAFSENAPFADHKDLHASIDSIKLADIEWKCFAVTYTGPRPEHDVPSWMDREYYIWYRCPRQVLHAQLGNPDFVGEMDFAPKRVYEGQSRVYKDFMTGDWAWKQAV